MTEDNGEGIGAVYSDRVIYVGNFHQGFPDGAGTLFILDDKSSFKGMFTDGLPSGQGVFTN